MKSRVNPPAGSPAAMCGLCVFGQDPRTDADRKFPDPHITHPWAELTVGARQ